MTTTPGTEPFWRRPQFWAITFLLASIGATVAAVLMVGDEKTTIGASAFFVLLAGALQIISAYLFSTSGRVSREHAASSFVHLAWLQRKASEALDIAETANLRSTSPNDVRVAVGYLSRDLDWIQEGLEKAGAHWIHLQPDVRNAAQTVPNTPNPDEEEGPL